MSVRNVHLGGVVLPNSQVRVAYGHQSPLSSAWPTYECHVCVTEAPEDKEKAGYVMQPGRDR